MFKIIYLPTAEFVRSDGYYHLPNEGPVVTFKTKKDALDSMRCNNFYFDWAGFPFIYRKHLEKPGIRKHLLEVVDV